MIWKQGELKNGLRWVSSEKSETPIVHMAVQVAAGTRFEGEGNDGLSHFLEHCLFKGTERKRSSQILSILDSVGGELNAYTTKEEICLYASFHKEHLKKAFDLFADVLFHSTFPEKEVEKERGVILDEIQSYLDSPSEYILDEFEELLFKGNSLGHHILGNEKTISSISRSRLNSFYHSVFRPENMVLSISGPLADGELEDYLNRYFLPEKKGKLVLPKEKLHSQKKSFHIEKSLQNYQCHAMLGSRAYSYKSKDRTALTLMTNLLGGSAMNSRLNLSLRERNGIAYTVEASFTPYQDTGLFTIYFGTEGKKLAKAMDIVNKEMKKLREDKLSGSQLAMAKKQMIGQISLNEENRLNRTLSAAKSVLVHGKVIPLEEVYQRIEKVTEMDVLKVANEVLSEKRISDLIYIPN